MTRARKNGLKWEGQYRFGGYWFTVKRRDGRPSLFASAMAARDAARKAQPDMSSNVQREIERNFNLA
jgi:hypothetical protein